MVTQPQPLTSTQPVIRTSPRPADVSQRDVPSYDTLFGDVLNVAQSLPGIGLTLSSPLLPILRSSRTQLGDSSRQRRLTTLRREEAGSRLNGESRISGANRLATQEALRGDRRADHEASNRDAPNVKVRFGSSGGGQPLRARIEMEPAQARRAALPANTDPMRSKAGSDLLDGTGSKPGRAPAPRGSIMNGPAPAQSAATVPPARASNAAATQPSVTAAKNIAKVVPMGSGADAPARSGAPQSGDNALQIRGKNAPSTATAGVNKSRPAGRQQTGAANPRQNAIIERIAKVLHAKMSGKETVARIQLDPPELGHVRINIRLKNDTLHLRLVTETGPAREALMSRIDHLRAALERHGLHVRSMDFPTPLRAEDGPTAGVSDDSGNATSTHAETRERNRDGGAGSHVVESTASSLYEEVVVPPKGETDPGEIEVRLGLDIRI